MNNQPLAADIDQYIINFPEDIQQILQAVRKTIKEAAPGAKEAISYQIPAFKLEGTLVYFAAYKNHIGFYPASSVIEVFKNELSGYTTSKGTIQFPFGKPIPLDLITRIVEFRVDENMQKAAKKKLAKAHK
jgi:uncharacterized protein YdhG (YjbR/CyaY superfamily)